MKHPNDPNLTNNMSIFIESMGKLFKVTHICDSIEVANEIMSENPDTAYIARDNQGRMYLALQTPEKFP